MSAALLGGMEGNAEAINIFLDYEQLCKSDRDGNFLSDLSDVIAAKSDYALRTPTEVIASYTPRDVYDFPGITREEESQFDLLNEMQCGALEKIYSLEQSVMQTGNENLIKVWGKLQASDHFLFMSTNFWTNGKRPHYLSSFESPYDACICYMNVLADLEKTIQQEQSA